MVLVILDVMKSYVFVLSCSGLFTYSLASCVRFLIIGVPTSTALSKPMITPEVKVSHPKPITAKMITITKKSVKNLILPYIIIGKINECNKLLDTYAPNDPNSLVIF